MDERQQAVILEVLDALARTEALMAHYYTACSEAWPEHSSFWMGLAVEEENHNRIILRLREIAASNPAMFEPGLTVEVSALESCNIGISEMADEIRHVAVSLERALRFAEGMESSLMESRFLSLLTSQSPAFQELREVVSRDTAAHHGKIRKLFETIGSGGG